ncbi:hypothetical protein [Hungatella effluvii]|uniref:hypothetical protein n=1 Tax=Hungatella effluvii TaxID=1096246 RepID=UPI0022E62A35|nr:hypothetical protein [Hungatella effluvii]
MKEIEKLWWAKRRIEEATDGRQRLIMGFGGNITVQVDKGCLVALYFAMVKNRQSGMFHCDVKGYVRTFSGYRNGVCLDRLTAELEAMASLVKELEHLEICIEEEELLTFCHELISQELDGEVQKEEEP